MDKQKMEELINILCNSIISKTKCTKNQNEMYIF